jgi:UDPglucose 6-dehydrogenase
LIERLTAEGARIKAYDPVAKESAKAVLKDIEYCDDEYAVARDSDAIVVVTEWNQFRSLDLSRIKTSMRTANLIDLRNIYEPDAVRNLGFSYLSIGRT